MWNNYDELMKNVNKLNKNLIKTKPALFNLFGAIIHSSCLFTTKASRWPNITTRYMANVMSPQSGIQELFWEKRFPILSLIFPSFSLHVRIKPFLENTENFKENFGKKWKNVFLKIVPASMSSAVIHLQSHTSNILQKMLVGLLEQHTPKCEGLSLWRKWLTHLNLVNIILKS